MSNQIQTTNTGNSRRRMNPQMILAIVAGLYGLSPIDAIPDFLPVVGQIDDASVILLALVAMLVMSMTQRDSQERSS